MSNTLTVSTLDTVRKAFDFTVDKFPLSGPDGMSTPLYGLFRSDTAKLVGSASVTARYTPHTTDDVLALIEATQEVFDGCTADCHFKDGHHVTLAPTEDMRRAIHGTNDNIFPRLSINAGYDGDAFKVYMGYFRDLCVNLHFMRSVKSTYVTIRHTNGLRGRMNELIAQFSGLRQGWEDLGTVITRMQSGTTTLDSFLDKIYGVPEKAEGREVTIHKNRTKAIFDRLMDERRRSNRPAIDGNYTVSIWEAFNAVQGYTQHDSTRRKNATPFDRVLAASNDQNVLKAERLAYEMVAA
jgi:Domain of unknown function (DUF932)